MCLCAVSSPPNSGPDFGHSSTLEPICPSWGGWGGGRRCSHEAGETDGGQGEPVGRYPEGKTPDFTQTLIEVGKAKESNWQKSFQSSQEKKGKGKESMGQGIS